MRPFVKFDIPAKSIEQLRSQAALFKFPQNFIPGARLMHCATELGQRFELKYFIFTQLSNCFSNRKLFEPFLIVLSPLVLVLPNCDRGRSRSSLSQYRIN